ncbi:MAG: aminoacyl-tRNA hydrolase [Phycisphaerae bacterium]|nr:aminoacyl-tRNA hydrolase [Phycisphaerae bacterium]
MKLIVGLGNPGSEYDRTRHNVGFEAVDRLARRFVDPQRSTAKARFSGLLLEAEIGAERVLLLRPTTFMNRSGQSVADAVRFHKMDASRDLLVITDDLALPCGSIRLRAEGGAGGHNGLADIGEKLSSWDFPRLRIGIDAAGAIPQDQYVLGRFRPDQLPAIESAIEDAVAAGACWAKDGLETAMNRFNRRAANLPNDPTQKV